MVVESPCMSRPLLTLKSLPGVHVIWNFSCYHCVLRIVQCTLSCSIDSPMILLLWKECLMFCLPSVTGSVLDLLILSSLATLRLISWIMHPLYHHLSNILLSFSLTQVVMHPTHPSSSGKSTLLDLAILSNPTQLISCEVISPLANSDHAGTLLVVKYLRKSAQFKQKVEISGDMILLILILLT